MPTLTVVLLGLAFFVLLAVLRLANSAHESVTPEEAVATKDQEVVQEKAKEAQDKKKTAKKAVKKSSKKVKKKRDKRQF